MNKHDHCGCDADQSDWRRGRYEPAEPPESERGASNRGEAPSPQREKQSSTKARRQR